MNPAATGAPAPAGARPPIGLVVMNLGGPSSLDDVEPFLQRLFGDPDVIQLGWLSFLQPLLARMIAKRRGPLSRAAYQQIGGRSPIREETTAQANAVAAELVRRGVPVRPVVAMAAWHPFADEALRDLAAQGIDRAVALPLYPHESRATTGSSLNQLEHARAELAAPKTGTLAGAIEIAAIKRYPDAEGYVQAVSDRVEEAIVKLPPEHRETAPVLFSAHGLPESYIKGGDPYLDDIRITVETVTRRLKLGARAKLCFQSRVGPQRWLGPTTEAVLDELAEAKTPAVLVVPVAFTGEHIETLQEIDILYKERAQQAGITHFVRARTVGLHPAFISALADLVEATAHARGWA
jgi:protoporphyrin/coproporphyrin ferrochelatase